MRHHTLNPTSPEGDEVLTFCPAPLLKNVTDWGLGPKDKPIEDVRKLRDEIETRVLKLIAEI